MINGAAMNIELYGIESQILRLLSESEGNILDNTALIETLAEAKVSSKKRSWTLECRTKVLHWDRWSSLKLPPLGAKVNLVSIKR